MFVLTLNNPTIVDPSVAADLVSEVTRQPGMLAFYVGNFNHEVVNEATTLWTTEEQANAYGSQVVSAGDAASFQVVSLAASSYSEADFVPVSEIITPGTTQF